MALSHYKNSVPSVNKYEVVNPSLFEATIMTPDNLNTPLLLEHVISIDGLDGLNPSVGTVTQRFKYAERTYATVPEQTHLELTITFTSNLSDSNENYIYTTLRKWCDRRFDPSTGAMGLKKDYCGNMIILQYNRDGSVWRKITCKDVFPSGQLIMGTGTLSYEAGGDAAQCTMTLICDWWDEEVIGL